MHENKIKRFIFFIATSMLAMLFGAGLIAYTIIKEHRLECSSEELKIEGKIIDVAIDKHIIVKHRLENKFIVESFDRCSRKNIEKITVIGHD